MPPNIFLTMFLVISIKNGFLNTPKMGRKICKNTVSDVN